MLLVEHLYNDVGRPECGHAASTSLPEFTRQRYGVVNARHQQERRTAGKALVSGPYSRPTTRADADKKGCWLNYNH